MVASPHLTLSFAAAASRARRAAVSSGVSAFSCAASSASVPVSTMPGTQQRLLYCGGRHIILASSKLQTRPDSRPDQSECTPRAPACRLQEGAASKSKPSAALQCTFVVGHAAGGYGDTLCWLVVRCGADCNYPLQHLLTQLHPAHHLQRASARIFM